MPRMSRRPPPSRDSLTPSRVAPHARLPSTGARAHAAPAPGSKAAGGLPHARSGRRALMNFRQARICCCKFHHLRRICFDRDVGDASHRTLFQAPLSEDTRGPSPLTATRARSSPPRLRAEVNLAGHRTENPHSSRSWPKRSNCGTAPPRGGPYHCRPSRADPPAWASMARAACPAHRGLRTQTHQP